MILRYDTEKLQKMVNDFHAVTGISVSVLDANKRYLAGCTKKSNPFCELIQSTVEGRSRCLASDRCLLCRAESEKQAVTLACHAGLADTVVPIYRREKLLGYIMFGQIGKDSFGNIVEHVEDLGIEVSSLQKAYEGIETFDEDKLQSAVSLVIILTRYVMLENIIDTDYDDEPRAIIDYIDENLDADLTVGALCRRFLLSKNALYDLFRECFGCSVSKYVLSRRLDAARAMLKGGALSVKEIGERCGIGNYPYFCRLFKKETGTTPLQYRKNWESDQRKSIT